jgi:hypothetical protein
MNPVPESLDQKYDSEPGRQFFCLKLDFAIYKDSESVWILRNGRTICLIEYIAVHLN